MELRSEQFLEGDHKREHFRTLLYIGVIGLPFFSLFDVFDGRLLSAAIEAVMAGFFVAALLMLKQNLCVKQTIWVTMVVLLMGCLSIMWQDVLVVYWMPLLTIFGFGFIGKKLGRQWAVFTIFCMMVLFVLDSYRAIPLYTLAIALNLVVSCAMIAFIVDYSYRKMQQHQEKLIEETVKRERLESSRTLAGGVAHLINNEMQVVLGAAEVAKAYTKDEKLIESLNDITHFAEKSSGHANQLVAFAQSSLNGKLVIDLLSMLDTVFGAWQKSLPEHVSAVLVCHAENVKIKGDSDLLAEVFLGILKNAKEAIESCLEQGGGHQGHISLTISEELLDKNCKKKELKAGRYILLCVADNGCGIPDEMKAKIFEPFVSTGFFGRGMGLAAAYGIMKNHQGHIEASNRKRQGSRFKIWLPAAGT